MMGIINRSRRGKMKLLINYNKYIYSNNIITIDRSEYGSEKERWIRELWIDITIRSKCGTQSKERWMDASNGSGNNRRNNGSESNRRSDGSVSNQSSDGS